MSAYKSCWWLQDHLEFGLADEIHACCYRYDDANGTRRGSATIHKVRDNRFPAEQIKASRERVHADIAAGTQPDCCGCPLLTASEWPARRYLAKHITMNVWSHCNLACAYCFTVAPGFQYSKVSYSIEAVIADMLAGQHLDPSGSVTWGGGDISALPEFNALAQMYIDYGVRQEFKTSAVKFLTGVARAIAENKGAVEVSVDAGTRETYAAYKGKDVWNKVVGNILRYREHGPVNLKYIADFPNVGEADIAGFIDLARRARPAVVTVTPEYNTAWKNGFDRGTVLQMSRLIHGLRAAGLTVQPLTDEQGAVLFPHIWPQIAADLGNMAAPSPI